MQSLKLSKSVGKVTVVTSDGSGKIVLHKGKKKKKGSKQLKPTEKLVRKMLKANLTTAKSLSKGHNKSKKKKKDGWLKDMPSNILKAQYKECKKL